MIRRRYFGKHRRDDDNHPAGTARAIVPAITSKVATAETERTIPMTIVDRGRLIFPDEA